MFEGLKVWNIEKGQITHNIERWSSTVAISADGKKAVSVDGNQLMIWELNNDTQGTYSFGGDNSVSSLTLIRNRDLVVVESEKLKPLTVWNCNTGKEERKLDFINAFTGYVRLDAIAVTDDGRFMLTADTIQEMGSGSSAMLLHALEDDRTIWTKTLGANPVLDMTGDGKKAVTISDNTLNVWDLNTGKELQSWSLANQSLYDERKNKKKVIRQLLRHVVDIVFLNLYTFEKKNKKKVIRRPEESFLYRTVRITGDGRKAVTISDNTLTVWDLEYGKVIFTLEGHKDSVQHVAITPDGKRAVSVSEDNSLRVWDLKHWDHDRDSVFGLSLRLV